MALDARSRPSGSRASTSALSIIRLLRAACALLAASRPVAPVGGRARSPASRSTWPSTAARRRRERAAMRLGPDEWLLSGPEEEAAQIAVDVGAALAGLHHSLVDVGHRHVALSRIGAARGGRDQQRLPARPVARGVPAGAATRTLLGKAEVILAKTRRRCRPSRSNAAAPSRPMCTISCSRRPASSAFGLEDLHLQRRFSQPPISWQDAWRSQSLKARALACAELSVCS